MPITIVPINGNSPLIDYNELQNSFENFLGSTCNEATMYVYNRFPVPVSTEVSIDFLFLICLNDIRGNWSKHYYEINKNENFKNVIIPVTIQSGLENEKLAIQNNQLEIKGVDYDSSNELSSLKFALLNFFEKRCKMDRSKLFFEPLQLILNDTSKLVFKNYIINNRLYGKQIFDVLKSDPPKFFKAYSLWNREGYDRFKEDAKNLNEVVSEIKDYGYLTKRKIERVSRQLLNVSAMYDTIGKQTLSINGKAGTGKTSHLLHLLIRTLKDGKNVTFLTYNHLLAKDIAYETHMIRDALYAGWTSEGKDTKHFPNPMMRTLMGFIFQRSRNLGVLHIMTESRVKELEETLKNSIDFLVNNLPELFKKNSIEIFRNNRNNWDTAFEKIQNTRWDVNIKQYGIAFVKYLQKNAPGLTQNIPEYAKKFRNYKMDQLTEISFKNVFLRDYPGCLKNTIEAIKNTESFYENNDIRNRYQLLDILMSLGTRKPDEDLKNGFISLDVFRERVRNVVKGTTNKSTILILDEAQDCHPYEREILYHIFKPENVVIANGGKEQLVRFSELCNWEKFNGRDVGIKKIGSGNKSYRIKQSILDFCNFIAEQHNIDLNLKSHSDEDHGHLVFDFASKEEIEHGKVFSKFLEGGKVNGCSNLESLLILDINNKIIKDGAGLRNNEVGVVNEYNVLIDEIIREHKDLDYLQNLKPIAEYWVGHAENKYSSFPAPNEVRIINYESCRGLEAWSVICFNIDSFYMGQKKSGDAERYLLHSGMILSADARASMYAITWILMAATRAIDTLYLQMSDMSNEFTILCKEYQKNQIVKLQKFK